MRNGLLLALLTFVAFDSSAASAQSATSPSQLRPPTPFRNAFYRQVCTFNAEGSVRSCKLETDFLQIEDEKDLGLLEGAVQVAELFSKHLKQQVDLETLQLVIEQRFFPTGDDGWKTIGKNEGEFLVDRSQLALTVAPDGRVTECKVLETGLRPKAEMQRLCKSGIGVRFEPDPSVRVRKGRQVSAGYLRVGTDGTDPKPSS